MQSEKTVFKSPLLLIYAFILKFTSVLLFLSMGISFLTVLASAWKKMASSQEKKKDNEDVRSTAVIDVHGLCSWLQGQQGLFKLTETLHLRIVALYSEQKVYFLSSLS